MPKSKPQGKLNVAKVLELKAKYPNMKHTEIAERAGSLAKSDSSKCQIVARVLKSSKYKELAHDAIQRSFNHLTDDKLKTTNAVGLSQVIERMAKTSGLATATESPTNNFISIQADKVLQYYASKVDT